MAETDVVREFYRALDEHDWSRLAATMSDDVVRVGMGDTDADTCAGKSRYLQYVEDVIGRFEHHTMRVVDVFYSSDGRKACAETVEEIRPPGGETTLFHCLKSIELDERGLITRFDLYQKTPTVAPPDWITVGAIEATRPSR